MHLRSPGAVLQSYQLGLREQQMRQLTATLLSVIAIITNAPAQEARVEGNRIVVFGWPADAYACTTRWSVPHQGSVPDQGWIGVGGPDTRRVPVAESYSIELTTAVLRPEVRCTRDEPPPGENVPANCRWWIGPRFTPGGLIIERFSERYFDQEFVFRAQFTPDADGVPNAAVTPPAAANAEQAAPLDYIADQIEEAMNRARFNDSCTGAIVTINVRFAT